MKTTRPSYTVSARNVVFTPEAVITATFNTGTFHGPLSGLQAWVLENKATHVKGCVTELGKHGLYPCLRARDENMARALSILAGGVIAMGDGITYATRQMAMNAARTLMLAGLVMQPGDLAWGITEQAYANSAQALKPKQLTLEEQLADCPF